MWGYPGRLLTEIDRSLRSFPVGSSESMPHRSTVPHKGSNIVLPWADRTFTKMKRIKLPKFLDSGNLGIKTQKLEIMSIWAWLPAVRRHSTLLGRKTS